MKRLSGSRKTAKLSESVHQHLNMYAIAAGAAGVSVLALARPSEAKIVYTPTNVHISFGRDYNLDLNNDGVTDFAIVDGLFFFRDKALTVVPTSGNAVVTKNRGAAAALYPGAQIGPNQIFNTLPFAAMAVSTRPHYGCAGNWCNVTNRYLGLKFVTKGKTRYGWARLSVKFVSHSGITATLTGYAYETMPGKSLKAGQRKEAADYPTNEDFGPCASLTAPIPDAPQPASLGVLALGAQGVPLWRRKESALEGSRN